MSCAPIAGDCTVEGETLTVASTLVEGASSHKSAVPSQLPLASVRPFRAERYAPDPRRMPFQCPHMRTRQRIPQTYLIPTPTGKRTSIRAERYAPDPKRMPFQCPHMRTRHRIPQTHVLSQLHWQASDHPG